VKFVQFNLLFFISKNWWKLQNFTTWVIYYYAMSWFSPLLCIFTTWVVYYYAMSWFSPLLCFFTTWVVYIIICHDSSLYCVFSLLESYIVIMLCRDSPSTVYLTLVFMCTNKWGLKFELLKKYCQIKYDRPMWKIDMVIVSRGALVVWCCWQLSNDFACTASSTSGKSVEIQSHVGVNSQQYCFHSGRSEQEGGQSAMSRSRSRSSSWSKCIIRGNGISTLLRLSFLMFSHV